MGKTKKVPTMSTEQLTEKINRIVQIRPVANEYRTLCRDVKEELQSRGVGSFETELGNTASVSRESGFTWVIEKLQKYLTRSLFETLCPRKVDSKKLNQRMAACPEDKQLASCRAEKPGKWALEVLAKGETAGVKQTEEEELEDAA